VRTIGFRWKIVMGFASKMDSIADRERLLNDGLAKFPPSDESQASIATHRSLAG
jgi:hypothetical protein